LIIGGIRCATGWIAQCLREHPEVFVAPDETHFFDRHYEKGVSWWQQSYFGTFGGEDAVVDKTASYLYDPDAPTRIANTLPRVKLICSFRDPIDRMYSDYIRKSIYKESSFAEATTYSSQLVQRSLYYQHLKRYLAVFPRTSILIKIYEDKNAEQANFIQDIYDFLDVNKAFVPPSAYVRTKPGVLERQNKILLLIYRLFFNRHLKSPMIFRKLYSRLRPERDPMDLDPETLERLRHLVRSDILELEAILGRELNLWRSKG
jgi:hypothetical protein